MVKRILILAAALVLVASFAWARGKPIPVKSDDSTSKTMRAGQELRIDAGTGVSSSVGGDGTGVSIYVANTGGDTTGVTSWIANAVSAFGTGGVPGSPPGTLQLNLGGAFTGVQELVVSANHTGVTSWFAMSSAGATIFALNWQGYNRIDYINGVTDEVRSTVGTTKYYTDGTSIKEIYTSSGTTRYFAAGTPREIETATGTTHYDAAGNAFWSDISGFYTSEINIPSGNITGKTAVFDTSRSGVSPSSDRQITTMNANNTGVSILASQYGTVVYHAWSGASVYGLLPITGNTPYIKFVDLTGTGLTIYATGGVPFQGTAGSATSAICIPPLYPRHYVTLFAVASGGTVYWNFEGSSAVSRWN